jgi:hypothetical protein
LGEFRRFACPRCQGAGKVFECENRVATDGACCPAGIRRDNCPGQKLTCQSCNGTGLRGYSAPVSQE